MGLEIHFGKTKILSNVTNRRGVSAAKEVNVAGKQGDVLQPGESVVYLGRCLVFRDFDDREIEHRVTRGWAKFSVYKGELCDKRYSLLHRLKLFNAVVTPTVLYGAECWTMTAGREQKLKVAQRRMLRKMLGSGRRAKPEGAGEQHEETEPEGADAGQGVGSKSSSDNDVSSEDDDDSQGAEEADDEDKKDKESWVEWMRRTARVACLAMEKANVPDWVEEQRRRKWRWAGHIMRRDDMRWSWRFALWEPFTRGSRNVGRPARRWEDILEKFGSTRGFSWKDLARDSREDRGIWKRQEADFVKTQA